MGATGRIEKTTRRRDGPESRRSLRESPADRGAIGPQSARPAPEERQLLELLLADPNLVPEAAEAVRPEEIAHPGLRRLLEGLYTLLAEGEPPSLDQLRGRLDNPRLAEHALKLQEIGRCNPDRAAWLRPLLKHFEERRARPARQELHNQLQSAGDHEAALELLRQLTNRKVVGAG